MSGNSRSLDQPTARHVQCPTCRKQVAWVESELFRPFCSRKCQLIDFGEWASERHAIPAEEPPDDLLEDGMDDGMDGGIMNGANDGEEED